MSSFAFAPVFGDGMVLQRDKELIIWGTSDRAGTVRIDLGEDHSECTVVDGVWKCTLPPRKAATGLTLFAKQGSRTLRIQNVMVGDVWLAGGQSNMEFFLCYEAHWKEAQNLPRNEMIRMYTCPRVAFQGQKPYQTGCGYWFGEADDAWETFSSAAYWFARELQPELDVPVGLLSCNWGGTSASAWVPANRLEGSDLEVYLQDYAAAAAHMAPEEIRAASMRGWAFQEDPGHRKEWAGVMRGIDRQAQLERLVRCADNPAVPIGPYHKNRPGCLYEQMILPIRDYAIKGVLWYQGENDVHHAALYGSLFHTLIAEWRKIWGADTPFLFAQLAPFDRWLALDGEQFPEIRRQQETVSETVSNCYMISTSDVGMRYDIHPKEKKVLGHRFFLQAMDKIYGRACLADSPKLCDVTISGNRVKLFFKNTGKGLRMDGENLPLFEIIQNGEAVPVVQMEVFTDSIVLTTRSKIVKPVKILFANQPYYEVRIVNSEDIPLSPFFWQAV